MSISRSVLDTRLNVIYSDRHIVAVNKPARIPVGSEDSGDITLLEMVRAWNAERQVEGRKGYCVPIHFLDRPVSGVILFAISSKAATRLNEAFRAHRLTKTYLAVVENMPLQTQGVLEHWLLKDGNVNVSSVVAQGTPEAKYCKLTYKVICALADHMALLEVCPVTGRSHQIRCQLAAVGSPLFGDRKYGARSQWEGCVGLHAFRLNLSHPVGNERLDLQADLPEYWYQTWNIPREIKFSLK